MSQEIEQDFMVFDSEESRNAYFQRIEGDLFAVEYGDAMQHANTTGQGPWMDEEQLFEDCSRIMLAEVRKYANDMNFCRLCDIQLSSIWRIIYESARAKPRSELADLYRKLGIENDNNNEALLEEADLLKTQVWLGESPPYQLIYDDIKRKGKIPDALRFVRRFKRP